MKRWVMRALAGLTAPAFCLLMSPKVWAAGRSTAAEPPASQSVGLSISADVSKPDASHSTVMAVQDGQSIRLTLQSGASSADAGVLSVSLLPSSPNRAPSRDLLERSERLWGTRVDRGIVKDTLFLYTVEVDGETVLERVGSGCIEENYYVRVSDLSDISVSGRCRQAPNWKEMEEGDFEEPVGEGGNLRLRGYLHKEGAELYTCREITVTDKNGAVVYYDLDQQEATRDEHYSFLVTTSGGTHTAEAPEPVPDSEQEPVSEPEPEDPLTMEREWTYVSSDGRELWRVDLQGRFLDGLCVDASGSAESLSDEWRTEDADFLAIDTDAVARVTVSRWVLGFAVARETYEFHLSPQ